jgi:hypothetical protein
VEGGSVKGGSSHPETEGGGRNYITVHRWKEIYLNVKSIRKKGYEWRRDYAKLRVTFEPRGV